MIAVISLLKRLSCINMVDIIIIKCQYNNVKFINLSVSTLGVLSSHSTDFITMLRELSIDDRHLTYIQKKMSTITIRSTYYIFCRRGQDWTNPELLAT